MADLERILDQDPLVTSSVMFGQGRFNAGALVDPIAEQRFDPVDATLLEEFRNKIWSVLPCHNYLMLLTLLAQAHSAAHECTCTTAF
jgi:hypothetical protein